MIQVLLSYDGGTWIAWAGYDEYLGGRRELPSPSGAWAHDRVRATGATAREATLAALDLLERQGVGLGVR